MAKIPQVQREVVSSIVVDISGPQRNPRWADDLFAKLQVEQPFLTEYLTLVRQQYGEQATLAGLLMYKFIESQMAADELAEMIG